jgi:hypothetical protein
LIGFRQFRRPALRWPAFRRPVLRWPVLRWPVLRRWSVQTTFWATLKIFVEMPAIRIEETNQVYETV